MAETSWPFETQDTTESQFTLWASALVGNGVLAGLATTVSSGMNLSVALGSAIVRGVYYDNSSPKIVAISAAHATMQRKDYVVLKLDLAANSATVVTKAGTATAGGGTFPALTQTSAVWEHPIAEITVPAGATNLVSGNIVNKLAGVGLKVYDYATAERPTPAEAVALGVDRTAKLIQLFTGGSWYTLNGAPAWADVTGKPATFAPAAHTHPATDVSSGVLAIARIPDITVSKISDAGAVGKPLLQTGSQTAALNALGIFVQASAPANVAGRLWVKTSA